MSLNSVQSFVIENCNGPTIENGLNNVCLHPLSRTFTFTITLPDTSCDFETGLCEFYQVRGDQFDWTRRRGATLTRETGPSRDHTSGNGRLVKHEEDNIKFT